MSDISRVSSEEFYVGTGKGHRLVRNLKSIITQPPPEPPIVPPSPDIPWTDLEPSIPICVGEVCSFTVKVNENYPNSFYIYVFPHVPTLPWSVWDVSNNIEIANSDGFRNPAFWTKDYADGKIAMELLYEDSLERGYEIRGSLKRSSIDYYRSDWSEEPLTEATITVHQYSRYIDEYTFSCENTALTIPDCLPNHLISTASMFSGSNLFNQDISGWDTSRIVNMSNMFQNAEYFNQPIGNWNTSKVTNMRGMFSGCSVFNQDISRWQVDEVTDMTQMFMRAELFNQDLSSWCVYKIPSQPYNFALWIDNWTLPKPVWGTCLTNTRFLSFSTYHSSDILSEVPINIQLVNPIGNWEIREGTSLLADSTGFIAAGVSLATSGPPALIFERTGARYSLTNYLIIGEFDQIRFTGGYSSKVEGMQGRGMKIHAFSSTIKNYRFNMVGMGISSLPATLPSHITSTESMFENLKSFKGDISNWDVSNVTNMSKMFYRVEDFNGEVSNWDVSNVTDMSYMFGAYKEFNQPLNSWDVSNVTTMEGMFYNDIYYGGVIFNQDISMWNVGNVTNMNYMFYSFNELYDYDLSGWDVGLIPTRPVGFRHSTVEPIPKFNYFREPIWGTNPSTDIPGVIVPETTVFRLMYSMAWPPNHTAIIIKLTGLRGDWSLTRDKPIIPTSAQQPVITTNTYDSASDIWTIRFEDTEHPRSYTLTAMADRIEINGWLYGTPVYNGRLGLFDLLNYNPQVGEYVFYMPMLTTNIPERPVI